MAHTHNEILFSKKKSINICNHRRNIKYIMLSERSKAQKVYVLYNSICLISCKSQNYREIK